MTAGTGKGKDGAVRGPAAVAGEAGGDGAEVAEEHVEVVTYAAAIDVAEDCLMPFGIENDIA